MLLGSNYSHQMRSLKEVWNEKQPSEGPIARLTPLGWTCSYVRSLSLKTKDSVGPYNTYTTTQVQQNLGDQLKAFWELSHIGLTFDTNKALSEKDLLAQKKVEDSIHLNDNGHYVVSVPWKNDKPELPYNREAVSKRMIKQEQTLKSNPDIYNEVKSTFESHLQKGYIRKLTDKEKRENIGYYLPFFTVVKPERTTTKVRIVFDAKAKYEGKSLNSEILQGPKLQNNLVSLLLGFRENLIAIAGDICPGPPSRLADLLPDQPRLHRPSLRPHQAP